MLNLSVRSLSMAVIGILLLVFREQAMPAIVMCVGGLFFLPALIALIVTLVPMLKQNVGVAKSNMSALVVSAGSMFLGLWMLVNPGFFVAILMWVLGAILSIAGLMQIIALLRVCRKAKPSYYRYIIPLMIFIAGLTTMFYPFEVASLPFLILGVAAIFSAVSDMLNTIFISKYAPKNDNVESVVEITDETTE